MGLGYLGLSAASTAASVAAALWWLSAAPGSASDVVSGASTAAIALLANAAVNAFLLLLLCLKTLFFNQLHPSETRKMLEHIINYILYKGTFLPLVVPPTVKHLIWWLSWLAVLCSLKMLLSLARVRLDRLLASPIVTPSKYFRVYSALLLVLCSDILWMRLCGGVGSSFSSKLFYLLFFEPFNIAFETLQAAMIHGFHLFDIWQRHLMDSGADYLDLQKSFKTSSGSFFEWKGKLVRDGGFILDLLSLLMGLGHYSMICWLRGMTFHLVDAVLIMNIRAMIVTITKRIVAYVKLRKSLSKLDGALPDATYDELCAFNDECAICRGPMSKAKKLSCNHLFHLACLRSWLDQGLTEFHSCPTCRRPMSVTNVTNQPPLNTETVTVQRIAEQLNLGSHQPRAGPPEHPVEQQQNSPDTAWRGSGLNSGWASLWSNPGSDAPSSSGATGSSVGLSPVQVMMRQLASVSHNYGHGDPTWSIWPQTVAGPSAPSSASQRSNGAAAAGLRFRGSANTLDVGAMVERVREVLPHIPDEIIIQDLLRTNNTNATVNNLLLMQ